MILWLPVLLVAALLASPSGAQPLVLQCDPCIERPNYYIRAIVHGTANGVFWRQVRAAALQAASDLRIHFDMHLYESFDVDQMANDILQAVQAPNQFRPDALIVTIPSEKVHQAVRTALEYVPVFGLNSGYSKAESLGVLGFVAMDEYVAGVEAARQFIAFKQPDTIETALFVNVEKGNDALDQRYQGFADTLQAESDSTPQVEELVVVGTNPSDMRNRLNETMVGCPYDIVLLSSHILIEHATSAFAANGCSLSVHLLATFDTSSAVYDAIAVGKLQFAVSQQQHLQGAFSVVMAAIYLTTGKRLARSADSEFGVYFSGPVMITLRNLPSDSLQRCELDAFPVCPNTKALDGVSESRCDCTDRSKIRIGGVVHGATTDRFWDVVFAQAQQAADDMGVELSLDRLHPEETIDILRTKMASKIISLCQEGVDGLFVSLPSADVIAAVRECQALSVPVISINAGADAAVDVGVVHHLAQVEYSAGLGAGQKLISAGMTTGVCLLHVHNHPGLLERCRGFEEAIAPTNVTFRGVIYVPFDNQAQFIKIVEDEMDLEGDWDGIGALLGGQILVGDGLSLQERHPKLLLGSFDTSDEIYQALNDDKILFGIDQVPFLQGYLPVPLLTWLAYTNQALVNTFIETGPSFIEDPPTDVQQTCEGLLYEVCPEPVEQNLNQLSRVRPVGYTLFGIVCAAAAFFIGWIVWNRHTRIVQASQPAFLIMICFGAVVMSSAIIPLSIDDSVASVKGSSRACMAVVWLFSLGFVIIFAALFSKIWRINKLMTGAKAFRRLKVTAVDVMLPFVILLSLNVIFLLIWTLADPMYFDRKEICGEGELSSYGVCALGHSSVSVAMLTCLVALSVGALVLANIQAYKAREFSTEFSESKYVGIAMIGLLQIGFVGAPVIVLVNANPTASFFVRSALIFVVCMSILLLVFVPKVNYLRKYTRAKKEEEMRERGFPSDVASGTGLSPLRKRRPSYYEQEVNGLYVSGLQAQDDQSPVPLRNVLELERLMNEQGIDSEALFKEAGIDTKDSNSGTGSVSKESDAAKKAVEENANRITYKSIQKESIVSFAEPIDDSCRDKHGSSDLASDSCSQ